MNVVLNGLLPCRFNWKLSLIDLEPSFIPEVERFVVVVQALIGHRFHVISCVFSTDTNES